MRTVGAEAQGLSASSEAEDRFINIISAIKFLRSPQGRGESLNKLFSRKDGNGDDEAMMGEKSDIDRAALADSRVVDSKHVGGIDLNSDLLNLQIKRDTNGVPLPLIQQPIENMKIEGFLPVIINVKPIDLPLLLGVDTKSNQTLSPPTI